MLAKVHLRRTVYTLHPFAETMRKAGILVLG